MRSDDLTNFVMGTILLCITIIACHWQCPRIRRVRPTRTLYTLPIVLWRRCVMCGRYAYCSHRYCLEHKDPAEMLPIQQSAMIRVEQFLGEDYDDDEMRGRMGHYFLWLEEKTMLMWDKSSVYLAYKHDLSDEEQLDDFLAFYRDLETATGALLGLRGTLRCFLHQRSTQGSPVAIESPVDETD